MSDRTPISIPVESPCTGCQGRRDFLRTTLAAAGALAGLHTFGPLSEIRAMEPGAGRALRYPLPAADGASIDAANEVILCRFQNEVFAFALSCPHQNTALKVLPKNNGFQCARHKSKYTMNGTFINGRATRNMDRLQITRAGDAIEVDPNIAFESDNEPAKWAAAVVKV